MRSANKCCDSLVARSEAFKPVTNTVGAAACAVVPAGGRRRQLAYLEVTSMRCARRLPLWLRDAMSKLELTFILVTC